MPTLTLDRDTARDAPADRRPHAVVIGSGFGGLAAAVRLGARGYRVTVLERLEQAGGRARVHRIDGFTFDAGPTIVTAPFLFEELWRLCGRRLSDDVELRPVSPFYRLRFDDGVTFDYSGDPDAMRAEVGRISPADVAGYDRFMRHSERTYRIGFEQLGHVPFGRWTDMARIAPDLIRLGGWRSVHGIVARHIRHPHLRTTFSFHPLLIGGNPFTASGIYALIAHLERESGVWFAMGGTGALVNGLLRLIESQGGSFRPFADVAQIVVGEGRGARVEERGARVEERGASVEERGASVEERREASVREERGASVRQQRDARAFWRDVGMRSRRDAGARRSRATGVRLTSGEVIDADIVVSNACSAWTYRHLLPPECRQRWTDRKVERTSASMGLFVWYFGTDRRYPDVPHHAILLGPRYRELLRDIFRHKTLSDDFSLYLHRPTATDPSLAPDGCDTFYVLSPVPNLQGATDWRTAAEPYRRAIAQRLHETMLPGFQDHVVASHVTTPADFQRDFLSFRGAGFGMEPVLTQSAWFRPHNRSEDVEGLYLVGAGTHPGAGLPGVLSSARVLDQVVPHATALA